MNRPRFFFCCAILISLSHVFACNYVYQGCWLDNSTRLIPTQIFPPSGVSPFRWASVWECTQAASALGFDTVGLQVWCNRLFLCDRQVHMCRWGVIYESYDNARAYFVSERRRLLWRFWLAVFSDWTGCSVFPGDQPAWWPEFQPSLPARAKGLRPIVLLGIQRVLQ